MTEHDDRRPSERGIDTERVDGGRRIWRPVVATVGSGLIIGALLGGAFGGLRSTSYQAVTALSVLPDSVIDTGQQQQQSVPSLDATSFIQGELVTFNSGQLADDVARRLNLPAAPDVSATEVGQTYVVSVTATASTRAQARTIATATGAAYKDLRTRALTVSINDAIRSTNSRLNTVQSDLAKSRPSGQSSSLTPAQTALQTEYERLLSLTGALNLALPQVGNIVSVQSQSRVVPPSLSPVVEDALIGAVLGALIAAIALFAYRRGVPRIRTAGDVAELGVPLLLPVLPRAARRASGPAALRSNAARLIAARLAGEHAHRILVVVGATPGVGTSYAANSLAAAVAMRGPVLLVQAAEPATGNRVASMRRPGTDDPRPGGASDAVRGVVRSNVPDVWLIPDGGDLAGSGANDYSARAGALVDVLYRAADSGWFVVVDAAALSESDLALDCLGAPGSVAVLVVARGASRPADVLSAAELFDARVTTFAGAILNDVPGRFGRRFAGRTGADLRQVLDGPALADGTHATDDPRAQRTPAHTGPNTAPYKRSYGGESDDATNRGPGRGADAVTVPSDRRT